MVMKSSKILKACLLHNFSFIIKSLVSHSISPMSIGTRQPSIKKPHESNWTSDNSQTERVAGIDRLGCFEKNELRAHCRFDQKIKFTYGAAIISIVGLLIPSPLHKSSVQHLTSSHALLINWQSPSHTHLRRTKAIEICMDLSFYQ
jgi:hypothetical protein